MNESIRDQWAEACQSGDYEQGRGCLRKTVDGVEQFCCLGILTDLAVKAGVCEWTDEDEDEGRGVVSTFPDNVLSSKYIETTILPPVVAKWAGLESNTPSIPGMPEGRRGLVALNDSKVPFDVIGKLIKDNL